MASLGRYNVPRELQDEDRWLKFFTKKQVAAIIIVGAIDVGLFLFFRTLHLTFIGIVLALLITAITIIALLFKVPTKRYLHGGGNKIYLVGIRVLYRKLFRKAKVVYTTLDEQEDE